MLAFLLALAVAGAPPGDEIDLDEFFRPRKGKEEKAAPSICPVCGKPLWMHADPNFVCEDPTKPTLRVKNREVTCPVCGLKFSAPLRGGRIARGGTDADFCSHPVGTAVVTSNVWMCVGCGYAALHADFEKAVDAKTKKFVREVLAEPTKSELRGMMGFKVPPKLSLDFLRLEDVPDTLEYENALQVYSFRQAPAQVLARLHLEASYACRRELCAPIMCEHIFRAIRKMDKMLIDPENLDATIPEKVSWAKKLVRETGRQDEKLSRDELYCISIRLAGCYARLGEGWNARDELITALSYADGGDPARATALKKIVRDRLSLLGREARHQSMACDYMTEVIEKGTFEGEDLLNAVYLVGEMCKRLGRLEEAVAWFRAARAFTAEKNEGLAKLAEKALSNPLLKRAEPDAETVSGPLKLLGLDKELERALSEIKEREKKKQEEKTDVVKVAVERASMTCEQILARIYRAVVEYEKSRGKIPSGFDDLTNAGLLTPEDANGFVCPESQHPLFYKKPKRLAGRDFVVYHKDPLRCPCRLVLLADGTIGTVDE